MSSKRLGFYASNRLFFIDAHIFTLITNLRYKLALLFLSIMLIFLIFLPLLLTLKKYSVTILSDKNNLRRQR